MSAHCQRLLQGQADHPAQRIMVHSTGANNPMLRRYVQPITSTPGRTSLPGCPGHKRQQKRLEPHWYQRLSPRLIGKLADGTVAVAQTLP